MIICLQTISSKNHLTRISNHRQTVKPFAVKWTPATWGAGFPYELPEDFEFSSRLVDGNFGAVFKQKSEHYKIEFYREAQMVVKER